LPGILLFNTKDMANDIKELEQKLTLLLGKQSYTYMNEACTGKYKGSTDYSLQFEDNTCIFISNGRKSYRDRIIQYINDFEYYHNHKQAIDVWLKELVIHDNQTAEWQGLPKIELIGTRIDNSDWLNVADYYMCINEELKLKLTFKETGFSFYCKRGSFKDYEEKRRSLVYTY